MRNHRHDSHRDARRLLAGLVGCVMLLAASTPALATKYTKKIFIHDWNGGEEIKVTSGTDTFTWTAAAAGSAEDCALAFQAAATAPFSVDIATNNPRGIRICHPTVKPKVEKKLLKNYRCYSFSYFNDPTPGLASPNLIEVRGSAVGGGEVSLMVEDIFVSVLTFPAQTPEEIVDQLIAELDAATPDDAEHSFGAEFTVADFGLGPLDSADISIWSLGTRDLETTTFNSTDPGIFMVQEAIQVDGCDLVEDFEPYVLFGGLHGQGGWKGWTDDPAFDAPVTDAFSRSTTKSVEVAGTADIVHEVCTFPEGDWSFEAWQYIPSNFTSGGGGANDGTYFILLNTYHDTGPFDWSVQMQFDSNDGLLKVHDHALINIGGSVPYDTDRWVKIQVLVDADDDWTQVYYDDSLVAEYEWTGGVIGNGTGALDIAAVDLYAKGSTSVYYDDLTLERIEICEGDVSTPPDNQVDVDDLLKLLAGWGTSNGRLDFDGSGTVDIAELLALLAKWGSCP